MQPINVCMCYDPLLNNIKNTSRSVKCFFFESSSDSPTYEELPMKGFKEKHVLLKVSDHMSTRCL